MKWCIIHTGESSAEANMAQDARFLEQLESLQRPILHLYRWKGPCATYGHFIDPYTLLKKEGAEKRQLSLARRPTGGGIIFHIWDLAFSVLVPASHPQFSLNTLENYAYVNHLLIDAVQRFTGSRGEACLLPQEPQALDAASANFCMAKPTKYDVMLGGVKVGGAAQRRKRWGYLHQGTISLTPPNPDFLSDVLQGDTRVLEAMQTNSAYLLGSSAGVSELQEARQGLEQALIATVST